MKTAMKTPACFGIFGLLTSPAETEISSNVSHIAPYILSHYPTANSARAEETWAAVLKLSFAVLCEQRFLSENHAAVPSVALTQP